MLQRMSVQNQCSCFRAGTNVTPGLQPFHYNAVIKSFLKRACLYRNTPGMGRNQKIHSSTEACVNPTKSIPGMMLWSILYATPFHGNFILCILLFWNVWGDKKGICCKIKCLMCLPSRYPDCTCSAAPRLAQLVWKIILHKHRFFNLCWNITSVAKSV